MPARWYHALTVGGTEGKALATETRWRDGPFTDHSGEETFNGSNYGDPGLDLSAPAKDIWSTTRSIETLIFSYGSGTGTSFAVPFAAGTVGLMRKMDVGLTAEQLKTIINGAADQVGGYTYSGTYCRGRGHSAQLGCGRLDAYEAVIDARDYR